ncbi:MAG: Crp/Fnr family transcriptional regulator [Bacteroidetes bacterium]|nr:Crp/Fnr family transcriptional regulator [Bacteroidota bacterium]
MDSKLITFFTSIQPISDEEINAIDQTMAVTHFKKGDILLKENQLSSNTYFILDGIVRQYKLIEGEEKTKDFFCQGEWILLTNNITNSFSDCYLQCCVDCTLVVGNSEKGEHLYKQYPNLGSIALKLMNNIFIQQQAKHDTYITDSPELRYLKLIKTNPDLFQQIPQYQIASYIGVTPESLSRIRKRILKK